MITTAAPDLLSLGLSIAVLAIVHVKMEAAKFWSAATLAFVLVLCITSTTVTWHCLNEVARLQSRVERLEAEDKGSSISQHLGQLGVQTSVYQAGDSDQEIPGHQREARQLDPLRDWIIEIVRAELETHLNSLPTIRNSLKKKKPCTKV